MCIIMLFFTAPIKAATPRGDFFKKRLLFKFQSEGDEIAWNDSEINVINMLKSNRMPDFIYEDKKYYIDGLQKSHAKISKLNINITRCSLHKTLASKFNKFKFNKSIK